MFTRIIATRFGPLVWREPLTLTAFHAVEFTVGLDLSTLLGVLDTCVEQEVLVTDKSEGVAGTSRRHLTLVVHFFPLEFSWLQKE